jgi:hypothetical protein
MSLARVDELLEFVVVPSMVSPEGNLNENESAKRRDGKVLANNDVGPGGKLVPCSFIPSSSEAASPIVERNDENKDAGRVGLVILLLGMIFGSCLVLNE